MDLYRNVYCLRSATESTCSNEQIGVFFIFRFFFSSRRRHTRFDCDWSSDVCSSDLTFYFHDFWNQPAPENAKTLIDALKNLSLIGALFMIAGYGKGPRPNEPAYGDM